MHNKNITLIFASDFHYPYVAKCYQAFKRFIQDTKPDILVLGGDFIECHMLSTHTKSLYNIATFKEEIDGAIEELRFFRKHCKSLIFIEGNHCFRLTRLVQNLCPQLHDVAISSIKDVLKLDEMKIEFVEFAPDQMYRPWKDERLALMHRPPSGAKNTAITSLDIAKASIIFGDTHRAQDVTLRDIFGEHVYSISSGCMLDIDHKIFRFMKSRNQWKNAFTRVIKSSKGITCELIKENADSFTVDGKLYQ